MCLSPDDISNPVKCFIISTLVKLLCDSWR